MARSQREEDAIFKLGNLGARSWLSWHILQRGADVATFFGLRGFVKTEAAVNRLSGALLAWSILRDRKKHKEGQSDGA